MRDQEQFLQVLDRDEAERRFRAAIDLTPRGVETVGLDAALARVRVVDGAVEPLAVGGASVLTSTTRADGFVIVPDDSEGFAPGADVEVWLYA